MGRPEKKPENRAKNAADNCFVTEMFCRNFPPIFCACSSAVIMANVAENGLQKSQRKNPAQHNDSIRKADQVVLYEQRKGSPKTPFCLQLAALHLSSHQQKGTYTHSLACVTNRNPRFDKSPVRRLAS